MFDEIKEILKKYFNYLKTKFNEEIGIIYGIYNEENKIEIDLIVGEKSEEVKGIRFFNLKKDVIYDLLQNSKERSLEILKLDEKAKKKEVGKAALMIEYISENFPIEHYFKFYTSSGKLNKDITYCEMIPIHPSETHRLKTFSLEPELFEMQVKA